MGYPKTATTTIQKRIFAPNENLCYLGIYPDTNNPVVHDYRYKKEEEFYSSVEDANSEIVMDGPQFDASSVAAEFERIVRKYCKNKREIVLSNERILSVFYSHSKIDKKIDRLFRVFGGQEMKLIIVIRRQGDMIVSQYRDAPYDPEDMKRGQVVSFEEWIEKAKKHTKYLESLKYNKIVSKLSKKVGKQNISILLFEELLDSVDAFAGKLAKTVGVPVEHARNSLAKSEENISNSKLYFLIKKVGRRVPWINSKNWLGTALSQTLKFLSGSLPVVGAKRKIKKPEYYNDIINDMFAPSNMVLEKEYVVPLREFNYPSSLF
jgi:hypothetical protein